MLNSPLESFYGNIVDTGVFTGTGIEKITLVNCKLWAFWVYFCCCAAIEPVDCTTEGNSVRGNYTDVGRSKGLAESTSVEDINILIAEVLCPERLLP